MSRPQIVRLPGQNITIIAADINQDTNTGDVFTLVNGGVIPGKAFRVAVLGQNVTGSSITVNGKNQFADISTFATGALTNNLASISTEFFAEVDSVVLSGGNTQITGVGFADDVASVQSSGGGAFVLNGQNGNYTWASNSGNITITTSDYVCSNPNGSYIAFNSGDDNSACVIHINGYDSNGNFTSESLAGPTSTTTTVSTNQYAVIIGISSADAFSNIIAGSISSVVVADTYSAGEIPLTSAPKNYAQPIFLWQPIATNSTNLANNSGVVLEFNGLVAPVGSNYVTYAGQFNGPGPGTNSSTTNYNILVNNIILIEPIGSYTNLGISVCDYLFRAQNILAGKYAVLQQSTIVLSAASKLIFYSPNNLSGINIVINGSSTETLAGPNNNVAISVNSYTSITSIQITGGTAILLSGGLLYGISTPQTGVNTGSKVPLFLNYPVILSQLEEPDIISGLTVAEKITLYSTQDNSDTTFTFNGLDIWGQPLGEVIVGPSAGETVTTNNYYASLTKINYVGDPVQDLAIGTSGDAISSWITLDSNRQFFQTSIQVSISDDNAEFTVSQTLDKIQTWDEFSTPVVNQNPLSFEVDSSLTDASTSTLFNMTVPTGALQITATASTSDPMILTILQQGI